MAGFFARKPVEKILEEARHAGDHELKRTLGALNLTSLGIGAIIGAGIFSLTGTAAAHYAGPGIVYSFLLGGFLCALAGVCYAELAAMIPVAGSAYAYSYATLGELVAWIIGWDLVLEYGFGSTTVAISWSGYLMSLLTKTLGLSFPDTFMKLTRGPWEQVTLADGSVTYGLWNLPASLIGLVVMLVLVRGIRESASVNNLIVALKVSIVSIFVILGITLIDPANLFANPAAGGLASLVPERVPVDGGGFRYGWFNGGVLTGAGVVFFAYIGFDAVSTTAQEAKNPQRDMPIGILASLVICTVLYVLVSLTLTGVVPYKELDVADPIAVGIDQIVALRGWSAGSQTVFTFLIKLGALAGLSSVILVMMLGQTRVLYAMSHDGLLPWFNHIHEKFGTPDHATWITGVFVAVFGGLMPISLVGELVSIGTLLAFVLVCIGTIVLRFTHPEVERPFRVAGGKPGVIAVGGLGAASCLYVMSGLPYDTWLRLIVWLVVGFGIYFGYGHRHSKLAQA